MYLIGGLGNPGEKYKHSRHNVGFIILDEIVKTSWVNDKYAKAFVFIDKLSNQEVCFVKPQNFMNNSGISIEHLKNKYEIATENILIIHDDIDLPFGSWKMVFDRGSGGHNGIKSIIEGLDTNKFVRIRVGIAPTDSLGNAIKPKPGFFQSEKTAVSKFVLKDFSKNDLEKIKSLAPKIKEALEAFVSFGFEKATNKFN